MKRQPPPVGKLGIRVTTRGPNGKHEDISTEDLVPETPVSEPYATVGCSVTVGTATEFVREKIEVSAWCTIPCAPDEETMKETYDECYALVVEQAKKRLDSVVDTFFPGMREQS